VSIKSEPVGGRGRCQLLIHLSFELGGDCHGMVDRLLPAMSINIELPADSVIEEAQCNLIAEQTLGATCIFVSVHTTIGVS